MRFIHLTSSKRLRSIARSGIRMGAGRRGRGVYAVPFVLLRFPAKFRSGPQQAKPPITSDPRSASHLWSWWCRSRGAGGHATIVFDAPADAWPADLYLLTVSGSRRSVIAKARELGLEVEREPALAKCAVSRIKGDLRLVVPDGKTMGRVLKPFLDRIERLDGWMILTSIEVVFRRPIPSHCIHRVVERGHGTRGTKRGVPRRPTTKFDPARELAD